MSLEHATGRRQKGAASGAASHTPPAAPAATPELTVADDLLLGAEKIAQFIYGKAGTKEVRDVYRNPFKFSFFKHGNAIAGLKSKIRAELIEAQQAAAEEHRQAKAKITEKPRAAPAKVRQVRAQPARAPDPATIMKLSE
jgi:hypothetical protein